MEDIGGVWRTVGGRKIFIKDGQDLSSAMKESGKFENKEEFKKNDNIIRKPEDITIKELEEIKKLADEKNEDGFKVGIEKAVFEKYGLNKSYPEVVNQEQFDKEKGTKIYRGISADSEEKAKEYFNQAVAGEIYTGMNNSGSGMWFTENEGIATGYKEGELGTSAKNGNSSFVIKAKIKENAKIINANDLPEKKERIKIYGIENDNYLSKIVYDDGLYAAMLGYDGIIKEVGFTKRVKNVSIVNRKALVVNENR